MKTILDYPSLPNRQLIELHLMGDRAAFREIVERHQGMICALGLSACGDIARSEDIAQEVFIAAWKKLPELREPEKLRGWLAGIARNLINNSLRRAQRTPTARAGELSPEMLSAADGPRERAIHADESALMWRALEGIPEVYREPMVLFYREQRSVSAVAADLQISEDNVRQRLARGRAMLTERVAKLVEETLERSAPTTVFAGVVLAALTMSPTSVEAAVVGGGAAGKSLALAGEVGGAAAKSGLAIKMLATFAALPALLNGLSDYLRFRAHLESPSPTSRRELIRSHVIPLLINAGAFACFVLVVWLPLPSAWRMLAFLPLVIAAVWVVRVEHRRRKELVSPEGKEMPAGIFEYRSKHGWLGLPWVHVVAGGRLRRRKAAGWIAMSDGVATGLLFASAPVAIAPVAVGGLALGAMALGGLALGVGAVGVLSAGGWAAGGLAFAVHAAHGGLALASDIAIGGWAVAAHANDVVASTYMQQHGFFRFTAAASQIAIWAGFFGWLPPLLLIGWYLRQIKRRS